MCVGVIVSTCEGRGEYHTADFPSDEAAVQQAYDDMISRDDLPRTLIKNRCHGQEEADGETHSGKRHRPQLSVASSSLPVRHYTPTGDRVADCGGASSVCLANGGRRLVGNGPPSLLTLCRWRFLRTIRAEQSIATDEALAACTFSGEDQPRAGITVLYSTRHPSPPASRAHHDLPR